MPGAPSPGWAGSGKDGSDALHFYNTFRLTKDAHKLTVIEALLSFKQSKAPCVCQAAKELFQHYSLIQELILYTGLGSNVGFTTDVVCGLRQVT